MSSSFSLQGYDTNLSLKQLVEVVNRLKQTLTGSPKEIVEILRFLHAFITSGKGSVEQIFESEIIPVLTSCLFSKDENVKIEAISLLTVVTFKNGKLNDSSIATTAVSLFSNLLETVDNKFAVQIVESISLLFGSASDSKSIVASVGLIMKLSTLVKVKEINDMVRMNVLTVLLNILSSDTRALKEEDEDDEEAGSTSSSASCAAASASSSSSSPSQKPPTFRKALAQVGSALNALKKSPNVGLVAMAHGGILVLQQKYGETVFEEVEEEGGQKSLKIELENSSSVYVTITGSKCVFGMRGQAWQTVFLKQSFTNKIYSVGIKMTYLGNGSYPQTYFGFCLENLKNTIADDQFVSYSGTACLYAYSSTNYVYYSSSTNSVNFYSSHPIKANSIITMELNMKAHTLHFFVDGKVAPYFIQNIPLTPLACGINGVYNDQFEVMTLRQLATPSPSIKKSGGSALNWQ